jgi:hypothetical protein
MISLFSFLLLLGCFSCIILVYLDCLSLFNDILITYPKKKKSAKRCNSNIQKVYKRDPLLGRKKNKNTKKKKLEKCVLLYTAIQVYRDLNKAVLSSTTKISQSSKLPYVSLSIQMLHIKHKGTILQTSKMFRRPA